MSSRVQAAPVPPKKRRTTVVPVRPDAAAGEPHIEAEIVAMARQQVAARNELRQARIAEAAYFRAEKRGFAPGHEVEDWLAAEADVDAASSVLQ